MCGCVFVVHPRLSGCIRDFNSSVCSSSGGNMSQMPKLWMFAVILLLLVALSAQDNGEPGLLEGLLKGKLRGRLNDILSDETRVWPELKFGWRMVLATLLAVLGASLGSVGGVGGGGIFVPMLILVVGFDAKTAPALSKCMIMAQSASTMCYNLKLKLSSTNRPLVDYELAVFFQPMLLLGISIGVSFNVVFPDWLITLLLIILSITISSRAGWRGVATWKKETLLMKFQAASDSGTEQEKRSTDVVTVTESVWLNVQWKQFTLLVIVWFSILFLQLLKTSSTKCSMDFWIYNALQVPIAFGITIMEAARLHRRAAKQPLLESASSRGGMKWGMFELVLYALCGILAGIVGGTLGVGGGAILGPVLLEFGVPPQTASATAIFVMVFSSSMSVVEFYLLDRIPVPYAVYFGVVCIIAAFFGQCILQRLVYLLGRTSIIIFVLMFVVFVSGFTLGGVGIAAAIEKLKRGEYMGFETLCV